MPFFQLTSLAASCVAFALLTVTGCERSSDSGTVVTPSHDAGVIDHGHGHGEGLHDHAHDAEGAMTATPEIVPGVGADLDGAAGMGESLNEAAADASNAMEDAQSRGGEMLSEGQSLMDQAGAAGGAMAANMQERATGMLDQVRTLIDEDRLDQAQTALDQVKALPLDSMPAVRTQIDNLQGMLDAARN